VAGQRALDEFLSGENVDPYNLVPKPEAGNMEDFFGEMSEEEIAQYKSCYEIMDFDSCLSNNVCLNETHIFVVSASFPMEGL
jgi:hypothetical protein